MKYLFVAFFTMCIGVASLANAQGLRPELVATGLSGPLFVTAAPGDTSRLFVLEKAGFVRIIKSHTVLDTPFLDLSQSVSTASERGLVGLAFHPNYSANGHFYVFYVNLSGSIVLARYAVSSNPDIADTSSGAILTTIAHPIFPNHNGGMMAFGPVDHLLYVGTGDGGGANDIFGNSQDLSKRLGKILRFDVGADGTAFTIPSNNPFVNTAGADRAIWAYGLRNPWRFSFDRLNGDLYIGDVGQDALEEIDFQFAASSGGQNYGWNVAEGFSCLGGTGSCGSNTAGFTPPILDYPHNGQSRSITGGYVYRGTAIPGLQGTYFYADFVTSSIFSLRYDGATVSEQADRTSELTPGDTPVNGISSFGEDASGELYFCDFGGGRVFKIAYRRPFNPAADVNSDSSINAVDVQLVINAALGNDTTSGRADINGDDAVNAVDVQMVINAVLGV